MSLKRHPRMFIAHCLYQYRKECGFLYVCQWYWWWLYSTIVFIRFYSCSDSVVVYMFVSGIGGGSILLLCLLDFITVLTVWLSICLLMVSVVALFYYCVYQILYCSDSVVVYMFVSGIGDGSILLLCLLNFIAVLTVWLSVCLLMLSVVALFYDCVYQILQLF